MRFSDRAKKKYIIEAFTSSLIWDHPGLILLRKIETFYSGPIRCPKPRIGFLRQDSWENHYYRYKGVVATTLKHSRDWF